MNETVLLRNQIAALTKESDEWMRSLEFSLKQRDKLTAERDEWKQAHDEQVEKLIEIADERDALKLENAGCLKSCETLLAQRDALDKAARLALDALEGVVDFDPDSKAQWSVSGGAYEAHECNSAINALKAVL